MFPEEVGWPSRLLWEPYFCRAPGIQLRASDQRPGTEVLADTDRSEVLETAHVIGEGEIREAGEEGVRETIDLDTEEIASSHATRQVSAGLRLSIYRGRTQQVPAEQATTAPRIYHYGERLRLPAKLRPPETFPVPALWDRGISRLDAVALTHGHSDPWAACGQYSTIFALVSWPSTGRSFRSDSARSGEETGHSDDPTR